MLPIFFSTVLGPFIGVSDPAPNPDLVRKLQPDQAVAGVVGLGAIPPNALAAVAGVWVLLPSVNPQPNRVPNNPPRPNPHR